MLPLGQVSALRSDLFCPSRRVRLRPMHPCIHLGEIASVTMFLCVILALVVRMIQRWRRQG
jgi:hypothetical protein